MIGRSRWSATAVAGFVLVASGIAAKQTAAAADATNGKALAQRWCVSCHVISPDQKSATTDAPPFSAIAAKPDFDASKLAFFLLDPHPKMPNFGLSREAAADLAAYIVSQRPR